MNKFSFVWAIVMVSSLFHLLFRKNEKKDFKKTAPDSRKPVVDAKAVYYVGEIDKFLRNRRNAVHTRDCPRAVSSMLLGPQICVRIDISKFEERLLLVCTDKTEHFARDVASGLKSIRATEFTVLVVGEYEYEAHAPVLET